MTSDNLVSLIKGRVSVWKKLIPMLLLISLLVLTFSQLSRCESQAAPTSLVGWQVEDKGGYYAESNGTLRLWSNGGSVSPAISFYKEIKPSSDFTFSFQVNAETPESCGVFVRSSLPIAGSTLGFNFEYGYYGESVFQLARNWSDWMASEVAFGEPHVWYTMKLSVASSPFAITTTVLDENGTSIGSLSTSEIANFTFEDIKYIGLGVWGNSPADYSFRNIQDPFNNPAILSISTESLSTTAGSAVNIFGTLSDSSRVPLQNKTVVLSYTFPGAKTWIPISSGLTNDEGTYNIQWINSASGSFTLKTEWSGDSTNTYASNTTTLNFLPIENKNTLVIESNSTVNALAFNNETATLSFNVTGPSGTTGFVKATIAKSLLPNGNGLQAYIDGKQLNYTVTSTDDSWVFTFNYSHSTHQISMHIDANAPATELKGTQQPGSEIILIVIVAIFGTILVVAAKYSLGLNKKQKEIN